MEITEKALFDALSKVIEPDLKKDIVALDLVKDVTIDERTITVIVEVSNPAMHSRKRMEEAVKFQLKQAFGDDVKVKVSVRPISGERGGLRKVLPFVKHVVAVASGKGGVGATAIRWRTTRAAPPASTSSTWTSRCAETTRPSA